MKKQLFIFLLLFVSASGFLFAEDSDSSVGENSSISIDKFSIVPETVGRGDLFTLTIILDYDKVDDVDLNLDNLPSWMILRRGPYYRAFIDTDSDKVSQRKIRITATFKADKSGRKIIPAFKISAGSKKLETPPSIMNVGLYRNRKLYIPLEVEWRAGVDEIYEGEAVPLFLTVLNQPSVVLFDSTRVALPDEGFFEKASGLGRISSQRVGEKALYDIPAAAFIYTPKKSGKVVIPAAGVDYSGLTGWSNDLDLKVKPVPEEISETGAVGNFIFTSTINKTELFVGEDLVLTCKVSGRGNLNYLKIPAPEVHGFLMVSSEETDDFSSSLYGFTGSKTIKRTYKAENSGKGSIYIPEFSFLDKESHDIITIKAKRYNLLMKSVETEGSKASVHYSFEKLEPDSVIMKNWHNLYTNPLAYIFLLPGLVFYLLTRIFKKQRLVIAIILSVLITAALFFVYNIPMNNAVSGTESITAVQSYNLAVDKYIEGDVPSAIHYLRSAVYLNPMNDFYREVLENVEQDHGFLNSIQPSIWFHPDLFFFILVLVVNLAFIAGVFRFLRSSGGSSSLIILFSFLAVFSIVMIVYTNSSRSNETGIVYGSEVNIKKIPKDSAEFWMNLKSGTAVKLLYESDNYYLVETGLGVKGWVENNDIIRDNPEL
ncbi:MAG: hypothetical protein PQJ46_15955 [Spirochaetales bacterium]|nr:hypothetical protein [Spirochaetales bacterium]